jgi:hypothetical protein
MLDFAPTASLVGRGEKQCETRESLNRAGGYVESTCFSGAVALLNSIGVYAKGCHVWLVTSAYVSCVSGFSCKMYIDLNHHISWI